MITNRTTILSLVALSLVAAPAAAQQTTRKLAFVIPTLYGPNGLQLTNPDHQAHFNSDFQANFGPLNAAFAAQITSLPLPSPASGFTYSFDPTLGVYERSAASFGPILAERAETIGKDKMYFGFAFQQFGFDQLDELSTGRIPSVFRHIPTENPAFGQDIITTNNSIDIQLQQTTMFFTYGVTDDIDVSFAVPFVNASMTVVSNATVQRIGTAGDPTLPHTFGLPPRDLVEQRFENSGEASGLGDVTVRVKGTVLEDERFGLAFGLDTRAPTGDEFNYLGSGAYGIKPFAALSLKTGRVSPHFNLAYQWNGDSLLAGDIVNGVEGSLPNQLSLAYGFDAGLTEKFSVAFDILSQQLADAQRIRLEPFTAANGQVFENTAFFEDSLWMHNAAAGFKVNVARSLLLNFNLLFKLNDGGLRDKVTPLIGLSYTL